ncbi:MAG: hypothetical protein CVU42_13510 [Chloroflexi bacterium HGW-Chloroflexi-4]|jgi:endonuclease/exonuclease/phosphatase family metal-dependent hydrolase|nr:MAG: hypothetical protein CVU42_13510 [Chloroflexi bacterium HGW-Chloroflexi-4]
MRKSFGLIAALGIIFLFFIQLAGTLVESIYLMDLLHSGLDEKILGVLFFFTPPLLIPLYKKYPRVLLWLNFGLLFVMRGVLPYLNVMPRMLISGLGVFAVVSLFFLLLQSLPEGDERKRFGLWAAAGLGLTISLSALLRTAYHGLEYSLTPAGGWSGWLLSALLGISLFIVNPVNLQLRKQKSYGGVTPAIIGMFLVLVLAWFSFSAPSVIARWTQANYTLIVAVISLFSTGWVLLTLLSPGWPGKISSRLLLLWNVIFTLCLTATLVTQQVGSPLTPDSAPVVITGPTWAQLLPLYLTLLLSPVIFVDMKVFSDQLAEKAPSPRDLVSGLLLASLLLIVLVFANIFTNVWGYVKPISLFFRGKYWLSYFLIAAVITLLAWLVTRKKLPALSEMKSKFHWAPAVVLAAIFISTFVFALPVQKIQVSAEDRTSIKVMTYNIQQANDDLGEKSFDRQLALIEEVSPDILSMQETDSARISMNNNDYMRFYADSLGYYSYFGPTPVMGTYGTTILSKYPLENMRTAYIYSDKDENANAEAEVTIGGKTFTIIDVHPDGSPTVDITFARTLIERSKDIPYVIALGDFNLRDYEEAYQLIDGVFTNVWTSIYPNEISADGVDMSGDNRIDHIFISSDLIARNPVYVLEPDSATDHPIHWAELYWAE